MLMCFMFSFLHLCIQLDFEKILNVVRNINFVPGAQECQSIEIGSSAEQNIYSLSALIEGKDKLSKEPQMPQDLFEKYQCAAISCSESLPCEDTDNHGRSADCMSLSFRGSNQGCKSSQNETLNK